ncbi:MAG TPA: PilZ domain-containing protein [Candidatus Baltobacteraceae bacterium]|jgi:c-di-GMP-binding flagellar brake protein YcgR|nr:PilZ domain-containing protein [Candidatus Baltobacteraceae bacterium]
MSEEKIPGDEADKRKSVRLRKYIPLLIEDRLESSTLRAALADISETGMRVIAEQHLSPGAKYSFIMQGPPGLSLRAEVRWVHDFERGTFQIGAQFIDVNEEDSQRLKSFLESERQRLTTPG